jgi:hypothetical protein
METITGRVDDEEQDKKNSEQPCQNDQEWHTTMTNDDQRTPLF